MFFSFLILLWRSILSYRNQSIDLQRKSIDWFLYDRNLHIKELNCTNGAKSRKASHIYLYNNEIKTYSASTVVNLI